MEHCLNCGAGVSGRFRRVFEDNNNRVSACLECASFRELQAGGAVSVAPVVQRGGRQGPHTTSRFFVDCRFCQYHGELLSVALRKVQTPGFGTNGYGTAGHREDGE
ncbi:DUF7563 family protein [Haladaptatus sp. ZSTT2]|uniref:DUF7563 family protein n=1 Tax=Haladaptatus sp. ZSTT2 TaxID=3120515 RepID=UPI003FA56044